VIVFSSSFSSFLPMSAPSVNPKMCYVSTAARFSWLCTGLCDSISTINMSTLGCFGHFFRTATSA